MKYTPRTLGVNVCKYNIYRDTTIAYDYRELYKKTKLKIVKYGSTRGYPKRLAIHIGLLKILRVNAFYTKYFYLKKCTYYQYKFG
jgi:hypothetical protein